MQLHKSFRVHYSQFSIRTLKQGKGDGKLYSLVPFVITMVSCSDGCFISEREEEGKKTCYSLRLFPVFEIQEGVFPLEPLT